MGQKDLTGKNFIMYPDVYADILNALVFAGRETVHTEDLMPAPTESFYYVGRGKLSNQFSDAAMYEMREGQIHTQYILENEVQPKSGTVIRKAGYEGAIYHRQLSLPWKYPIVSLLLYWGNIPWSCPTSIRELFQDQIEERGIEKYIAEERLHIYSMMHLPKCLRNLFKSDMRFVVDILAEGVNYRPTEQKILHPEALMLMLSALTNDRKYGRMLKTYIGDERKGELTMCEFLDAYEKRSIEKGKKQGMKQGIKQGITQGETRFATLNQALLKQDRIDDIRKASGNKRYRNQLYREFGIL
ncbi:MAG: hypothetical protein NC417_01050 [Candidatus Gastranaerophilales bacterium]|nr:hypothetical protein [Candidatus Gastranaerophilales bacterium]